MQHHTVTRALVIICAASTVGYVLSNAVAAQELGQIYAYVMNQSGQPITDLTLEEFAVAEDETDAKVLSTQIGTEPMKVALLLDNGQGLRDDVAQLRADRHADGASHGGAFGRALRVTDGNDEGAQ